MTVRLLVGVLATLTVTVTVVTLVSCAPSASMPFLSVLSMAPPTMKVELRSTLMATGAPSVTYPGTLAMLPWSADSWDMMVGRL